MPILYHVVPHLFVGIGPYYNLNVAGDGENNYGFTLHRRRLVLAAPRAARCATTCRQRPRAAAPPGPSSGRDVRVAHREPSALREPTSTTSRLPRVTAV